MRAVVITLLSFPWRLSHSSVSSAMITQPHESQNPTAAEKHFYFSLSLVFTLVIYSYVCLSKCSTKAEPEALELDHFTATLLEASLAEHQAEHLALLQ